MLKKLPDGIMGNRDINTNKIPENWIQFLVLINDLKLIITELIINIKKLIYPNKPVSARSSK